MDGLFLDLANNNSNRLMLTTKIRGLFLIAALLSVPLYSHSESMLNEAVAAAQKIHPAPNGKWELVVQPFWKNHLVLRLVSTSFSGWYHRPTIAVSSSGKATILTDGVIRLPQSRTISSFNEITISENLHLNRDSSVPYAAFFLNSHLSNGDFLRIQAPDDFLGDSPEPTFWLHERDDAFLVEAELVNKK